MKMVIFQQFSAFFTIFQSGGWTWTLVVLSVLGLVNSGPLSVVIGLCAVIGGLQALGVIGGDAPRAV